MALPQQREVKQCGDSHLHLGRGRLFDGKGARDKQTAHQLFASAHMHVQI